LPERRKVGRRFAMSLSVVLASVAAVFLVRIALRRSLGDRKIDLTALAFLRAPIDALTFRARRRIAWRRGPPNHANETKEDLFDFASPAERVALEARERDLRERYALAPLRAASTREVYRDNLYVLDLLDGITPAGSFALDVGAKDFRYAFALERWLVGPARLVGIEIDGHVVYADLHSRADHAEAFANEVRRSPRPGLAASEVRYLVADFLETDPRDVDVVFFFFPFVLRYALVRWGLPLRHFAPESLFVHAVRALRPGGLLVVVNHTEEEAAAQRAILASLPVDVLSSRPARSALVSYAEQTEERTLTLARRR